MQNDFIKDGGTLVVPDAEATLPRIAQLLELARQAGMRVVFSQDTHDEGDPEWTEASLRQTAFLFAGKVTTTKAFELGERAP